MAFVFRFKRMFLNRKSRRLAYQLTLFPNACLLRYGEEKQMITKKLLLQ